MALFQTIVAEVLPGWCQCLDFFTRLQWAGFHSTLGISNKFS